MTAKKRVEEMIPKLDKSWSTYTTKGDRAVNTAMISAVSGILDIMNKEEKQQESGQRARKSIAQRFVVAEFGVAGFRLAEHDFPGDGLGNTEVRGIVHEFLNRLLTNSGVSESLAKEFTGTLGL
jgi:hypothetical protein